jgi:hypothetical protein
VSSWFSVRRNPPTCIKPAWRRFSYTNVLGTIAGWFISKLFKNEPEIDLAKADELGAPSDTELNTAQTAFYTHFLLLADNRTTRLGTDDPAALAELLQEILAETGTLSGTGFDPDALDEILADLDGKPPVGGADEQGEQKRAVSCPCVADDNFGSKILRQVSRNTSHQDRYHRARTKSPVLNFLIESPLLPRIPA